MRTFAGSVLVLLSVFGAGPAARAEDEPLPPRVRIEEDSIVRWAPRYVLTADEQAVSADSAYWRRIDQLPLYQRLALDGDDLLDGSVDVHLSAWGALDVTFGESGGIAAGDFAVAYARERRGPFSIWGGRRFLPWGLPGGVHVDGAGADLRAPFGLVAEAAVGRPVTPVYDSLVGPRTSFEGPTLAYGARLGWVQAGRLSASVSYLERLAEGIRSDRAVSLDAMWVPFSALDVRGDVIADVRDGLAVEQGLAQVSWYVVDALVADVAYAHADPRRMLPSWSILSAFATATYDEGSLGATLRLSRSLSVRAEGATRHYALAGEQRRLDGSAWGYRLDAQVRYMPPQGSARLRLSASRRDDGTMAYTVLTGGASFLLPRDLVLALEAAGTFDDGGDREAALGRATFDVPIGESWHLGVTVDLARTAIAESELRALVHASWRHDSAGTSGGTR